MKRLFSLSFALMIFAILPRPDNWPGSTKFAHAFNWDWDQGHQSFQGDSGDEDTDPGDDGPNECGSPVEVASGNFVFSTRIVSITGIGPNINVSLTYNSRDMRQGPFGNGWIHTYDQRLVETTDGVQLFVICRQGNGKRERFIRNADSTFTPPPHIFSTLMTNPDGTFTLTEKDGMLRQFSQEGWLTEIIDPKGNALSFSYDSNGFLTTITDTSDRAVTFTKGADGRVANLTNPLLGAFQFFYDTSGNLTGITDPTGNRTNFQYDTKRNLTAVVDPQGNTQTAVSYDSEGRVATHRHGAETWTYTYLPSLNRTTKRDSAGNTWIYEYNSTGNITKITDPLGGTNSFVYDENLRVIESTNANGNGTVITYDPRGNPLTVTDPLGITRRMTYDPVLNRLLTIQNAAGSVTSFEYDARGNLTKSTNAFGEATEYEYDPRDLLTRVTDPLGNVSTLAYDIHGNLIDTVDPMGNRSAATYDLLGKILTTTDSEGRTIQYEYDANSRLIQSTDPDGGKTSYNYDTLNSLVSITTASEAQTTFQYDLFNRLTRTTNPLGFATTFTYDTRNNLISSIDPKGQKVVISYDGLNRVTSKVKPDDTVSYSYDRVGNLLDVIDGDSHVTFVYDAVNRPTQAHTGATSGQPQTMITYTYDADGNRQTMTDPAGGVTSYTYDEMSQLLELIDPSGHSYTFTYDSLSRRTGVTLPAGLSIEYRYDAASRLANLVHNGGPGNLPFTYTYDGVANRLTTTDADGLHRYNFDLLNRLTGASHPGGIPTETYRYDVIGNRTSSHLSSSYTHDLSNRLTADSRFDYSYDANGNLDQKTERAGGGVTTYTYDSENQLTGIEFPDGTSASYRYDGLGRRIEKQANGQITQYVYDEQDILFEYVEGVFSARYTHGPSVDEVLSVNRGGGSSFFQTDAVGSVRRLVDEQGVATATYTYDSFGQIMSETGIRQAPYQFQGREFDPESGLYYFRARYYDPQTGRFINEDPLGFTPGPNFYIFAENNPVNFTDPFGLEVGFWESLIPVWGSGKQAYEDFACGRWGWGIATTALAISDVFLVKAIVTGFAKAVTKTGLKTGMSRANPAFPKGVEWVERSHWTPKRYLPDGLKDAGWNMKPMWGTDHALADPFRYRFMRKGWKGENPLPNNFTRQLNRIPDGVKGAGLGGAYTGGRGANNARDADCSCQ